MLPKKEFVTYEMLPMALYDAQAWWQGEAVDGPAASEGFLGCHPLFHYQSAEECYTVYYPKDEIDANFYVSSWVRYFTEHPHVYATWEYRYRDVCRAIDRAKENSCELSRSTLYNLQRNLWPMLAAINIIARTESLQDTELYKRAYQLRTTTDHYSYDASILLWEKLKEELPSEMLEMAPGLLIEEIVSGKYPDQNELHVRKQEHLFYDGKLYVGSLSEHFEALGIILMSDVLHLRKDHVRGQTAQKGTVRGVVMVVKSFAQFESFTEGMILVASMTTPDYLLLMKKAAAFVTDAGGITCHAAIIAREMGKPCIIGTKVATQVLKDGDLVEVDADRGVVRILERAG